ncbi:hypothetical protein GE21DRAFT_1069557 [Neurospora crassa]|nr:hypothetical protein GE21DRAFT_1069557 [Neurospora crassa]
MLLLLFTHLVVGLGNHGCPSFGYLGSRSSRYHPSDLHHSFLGQFDESFLHGLISLTTLFADYSKALWWCY